VNTVTGEVWLSGFGLASRLPRERQAPEPPETIAGTLPYMAPEQTGRMNRSIDSRSDLYSFGVTLYQMLTGALPFTVADPMEWVHCHIARQPVAPDQRLATVPASVSRIVMKLLAKTAEERYQTAAGVERDLRRSLASWERDQRIDDFPPGEHDTSDRLLIPEKLYGREREVETLLAAFERIAGGGAPELVLVSGYSGIGKSSVVNELHKALVPPRGLFAFGKFDQYNRDIPYSTLVQAFQSLVRTLLAKSDVELAIWRGAFMEALAPNARLMADLIPELRLIIGDQPPVPELEPLQAQGRFQLVFGRFIGVFARPEHPLALFLDDLQWLDAATLDLLEDLLTRSDLRHLMLIGAYRDNEVDDTHPLIRKLDAIRHGGARVNEICLVPLGPDDLAQMIADALRIDPTYVATLADLVHAKTAGNPFFVIQFLYTLAEEGLLRFDYNASSWSWDLSRIHAKGYTDNVVDLMVGKLQRMPMDTQHGLQQLSCLGNISAVATLSMVLGSPEEQMREALWPAIRQELIVHLENHYRFIHDRVQEAAYSLIPEALRAEVHLRIGRLLLTQTPLEKREESVFEIVNQLNRGAALITEQEERERLAELNLIAGKRAKGSTAYASALTYLNAGAAMLTEDRWERRHELTFALAMNRAECEFLTGQLTLAEDRLAELSNHATTTVEQAIVACLRIDICTALNQSSRAVAVGIDYLRHVGIEWSPHPEEEEVRREYESIWSLLADRTIEDLIELPLMDDAASLATVDVLIKVFPPAQFTNANLSSLTICKAVHLSLERGNCDASCFAYVQLARIAGPRFGDYQAGFRFGQLGYDLVERRSLKRFEARTCLCFAIFVVCWMKHIRACRDLLHRAFEAANRIGDLTYGGYTCNNLNTDLLFAGDPLVEVQGEAERGLAFAEKARFGLVSDFITTQLALIRTLRGLTPKFGCFDYGQFSELRAEDHLSSNPALAIAECFYWIRKLQANYFAGDYPTAMDAASKAQPLLWTSSSILEEAEYHFYGALAKAAWCDSAAGDERQAELDALGAHRRQLQVWSDNCPENFENRVALVGAEIARLEGRELDAERLYEQAICSARENGFVHNEALACEVAARFYAGRGLEDFAHLYLRKARYCYLRWGANGKVRQIDEMYPHLRTNDRATGATSTIAAPVEHLDLGTVINVSQAVSGEIVLERLIHALMRTTIQQAGAERGLLILTRGAEPQIEAEATTSGDTVAVQLRDVPVTAAALPESVLNYVLRTRESVILDAASAQPQFATDPYIRQYHACSILCMPLMNQARLIGALYLENNLTTRAFTPARIAVLKLIASQAAISLENTRLYRDLEQREARIRRLVDANIIGIIIWELEGRILEANEAFLRMTGYDQDDVASGRLHWTNLTPPEWLDRDTRLWIPELMRTGNLQPYEKEYFRKDGSRVPVLIGVATFDESSSRGVGFVLDLTERKRAEEARQEIEEQWKAAFESNPTMYFIVDEAGGIVSVNPYGAEQLGYTVSELVGQPVLKLFYEPDREPVQAHSKACLEQPGRMTRWEARKIRKDGAMLWVRETANAVFLKKRLVLLVVCENITEQRRAEEALRRSEAYLSEAQKLTKTGSLAWDPVSHETFHCSDEIFRMFGLDPQKGMPAIAELLERVHPDDREYVAVRSRKDDDDKAEPVVDYKLLFPNGVLKYIHSIRRPILDDSGEVVEFMGSLVDVTEQHRSREALEKAFEEIKVLKDQLYKENLALREEVARASMFEEIVGESPALQSVLARVAKVGPTDSTVLITGETGTGKELIARAIHKSSRRSGRAFVSVNCSALAPSLISSELFGHEKGAFTGATQRRMGRFELADGGTIFLDEVGEIPLDTQVALLRVLQEREFERVGGTQSIRVDVRIIAATNRDLRAAMANGTFRQDLFYRLNVLPIEMPPLRERKDDVLRLVRYFVNRYASRAGKKIQSIDKKTLEIFQSYDWPGNIRELQNIIERSVILTSGDVLRVDESWLPNKSSPRPKHEEVSSQVRSEREEERTIIEAALRETRGRVSGPSGAAAKLKIPPSTLEKRIKALKIRKGQFKFG
jgi:PAS domain S-box-containing protein